MLDSGYASGEEDKAQEKHVETAVTESKAQQEEEEEEEEMGDLASTRLVLVESNSYSSVMSSRSHRRPAIHRHRSMLNRNSMANPGASLHKVRQA